MSAAPTFVLVVSLIVAATAELWNRHRPARPDSGTLWTVVVERFGTIFWISIALSTVAESVPMWWSRGYHLFADRTGLGGATPAEIYPWVLALPVAAWALCLAWECVGKPKPRAVGRRLSGATGLTDSRLWILGPAMPLVLIAATSTDRLGGGADSYSGAMWSGTVVFILSLIGAGLGRRGSVTDRSASRQASIELDQKGDWHAAMTGRGLELQPLGRVDPPTATAPSSEPKIVGGKRSLHLDPGTVAPQVIQALHRLIDPALDPARRSALIVAPDDIGQAEGTAAAAALLHRRYLESTLVVTARGAEALAERLQSHLDDVPIAVPTASEPLPAAALRVVDAETLSDAVLPRLRSAPALLDTLGLVVWWDLHEFSGIYAANLWALSRRLRRLLRVGGDEARILAFLRAADYAGGQLPDFVRRVLPDDFSGRETYVPVRPFRRLHLYALGSQQGYFERRLGDDVPSQFRHPSLVAARESHALGWSTYFDAPAEIPDTSVTAVVPTSDMAPSPAVADAAIRPLQAGDALSLLERFAGAGRASALGDHYLGLVPPRQAYARFLTGRLGERLRPRAERASEPTGTGSARRLICAEGDERLMRRHLLSALSEKPATLEGLKRDFLRDTETIREVLSGLADSDALTRREVRSLDQRGRLVIDTLYASRESADDHHHPLDTVGRELVQVVDPAAGHGRGAGVRLRLDPERATILAYPGRVFSSHGRRYQVSRRNKGSGGEPDNRALFCHTVDEHSTTWRRRFTRVRDLHLEDGRLAAAGLTLRRAPRLTYEETVLGYFHRRTLDLSQDVDDLERFDYERPLFAELHTRGFLLLWPRAVSRIALVSLCAALKPVLDVHLAVEDDVLEVVPVHGVAPVGDPRPLYGLALVELYPGGIGLLDVLHDADRLLPDLLYRAHRWLAACSCGDEGCERCVRSAEAAAGAGNHRPRRDEALQLLQTMSGPPEGGPR